MKPRSTGAREQQERGFALLLVFVLAAAIALMLYKELPRVAFEAQRSKEDLLIQRGESYQRAIQLFYRKFKKYPAKMEDLDNTNQVRFLRKHFDDPMTGKSEWRLIHIGAGGLFTDSLTHKPPSLDKDKDQDKSKDPNAAANSFVYEAPSIGSAAADPNSQQNAAVAPLRASEKAGLPPMPGQSPAQPVDPSNPQAGLTAGYPGNPNQPVAYPPGIPGMPQGVNPATLGQQPYGQQQGAYPGQAGVQTGVSTYPYSTQPGAQGSNSSFAQPGTTTNPAMAGQNQAMSLINQILTTPRPNIGQVAQPMAGLAISPGIAGVASTSERKGIKIYNEKQKYKEWEFIYDLTKDTSGTTMTTGISGAPGTGTPGQQQGQQGTGSSFGSSPFGSSGFGAAAGGVATSGQGTATTTGGQGTTGTTGQQTQQPKLSPQEQYQQQYMQQLMKQQAQQAQQPQQPQPAQPVAPDPAAPTQTPGQTPSPTPGQAPVAPGAPTPVPQTPNQRTP